MKLLTELEKATTGSVEFACSVWLLEGPAMILIWKRPSPTEPTASYPSEQEGSEKAPN